MALGGAAVVVVVTVWLVARMVSRRVGGGGVGVRRSLPISAYVGANGAGKTLAMIHDTLPTLAGQRWVCDSALHLHTAAGVTEGTRTVLSTVELRDPVTGDIHPLYRPLTSWRQLVAAEHCDVLLDEVTGAASARSYQALPPQLLQLFLQLRKVDVLLRYSTPNWGRTDVAVREVTQAVTVCKGFMPERTPESRRVLWPMKRLFRWATYDAVDWESLTMSKLQKARPLLTVWYWRPGRLAQHAYRTHDSVATLDHVSDAGLCLSCGGTRARPKCGCVPVRPVEVEVSSAGSSRPAEVTKGDEDEGPAEVGPPLRVVCKVDRQ